MTVSFFDTKIFLYAASNAAGDSAKKQIASELIRATPCAISAQVMQEFIANALRKQSLGLNEWDIGVFLEFTSGLTVVPITAGLVATACQLRLRHRISHWDATILAAALHLGCKTLHSEDLNHGQIYDGVEVINPFQ